MINDPEGNYVIDTEDVQSIADNIPLAYAEMVDSIERDRMMQEVRTAEEFWDKAFQFIGKAYKPDIRYMDDDLDFDEPMDV